MAKAEITPRAGDMRVWTDDDARWGERYEWCCGVTWIDRESVEFGPYIEQIKPSQWKAMIKECQRLGITRFLSTTYPNGADGKTLKVWRSVPTPFETIYGPRADRHQTASG